MSCVQVYKQEDGTMFKSDRQWGKTLNAGTMDTAFQLFADNGRRVCRVRDSGGMAGLSKAKHSKFPNVRGAKAFQLTTACPGSGYFVQGVAWKEGQGSVE